MVKQKHEKDFVITPTGYENMLIKSMDGEPSHTVNGNIIILSYSILDFSDMAIFALFSLNKSIVLSKHRTSSKKDRS